MTQIMKKDKQFSNLASRTYQGSQGIIFDGVMCVYNSFFFYLPGNVDQMYKIVGGNYQTQVVPSVSSLFTTEQLRNEMTIPVEKFFVWKID